MSYASGDSPKEPGHYACIHCDTKIDITGEGQVLPKCNCPEGKGSWVERAKEYEEWDKEMEAGSRVRQP